MQYRSWRGRKVTYTVKYIGTGSTHNGQKEKKQKERKKDI